MPCSVSPFVYKAMLSAMFVGYSFHDDSEEAILSMISEEAALVRGQLGAPAEVAPVVSSLMQTDLAF